jgi:hypothetical protein
MKKHQNFLSDDFSDFVPKRQKISKNVKSKQLSFLEMDNDDYYTSPNKKSKYANYKIH